MAKSSSTRAGGPKRTRALFPIRVKLGIAIFVPLVAVAGLSLVQVSQAKDRVTAVEEETRLASVSLSPGGLTSALIVEQGDATVTVLGMRETATFPTATWEESKAETDQALEDLRKGVANGGPEARRLFANALENIESNLQEQRTAIDAAAKTPGLENWDLTESIYPAYSGAITSLRQANLALTRAISDPEMRSAAETLDDVNVAHSAVSALIKRTGTALAKPEAKLDVAADLRDYEQAVTSLRSRNSGPWADAVTAYAANPNFDAISAMVSEWLETGEIVLEDLIALNPPVADKTNAPLGTTQRVAADASNGLLAMIDTRIADAKAEQQRYTIIGAAVMLGATIAALVVASSILRPMRKLTTQAEDMAAEGLPNAVQSVLNTPPHQDVVVPELAPVSVKSRDELQTVATAINHVQASALDLAVEQATLRRNIADSFVSLGRRTQNLIGLQLELITELEESETDPAVLESLYKLDHLATRARRNAESLVVLGGTEAQRTGGLPVATTDVVRASLSEVEAYQRVSLQQLDVAYVPATSAADLIHLIAELVENGLSFSPPSSDVEVTGKRGASGYTIEIVDHGVGMTAEKLAQANRRLSDNEAFTVAPSRYLGHYVTGKLAARIGAHVSLAAGANGGVVATVVVPTAALLSDEAATQALAQAANTPEPPARRSSAAPEGSHADPEDANVRVDGRPPAVVTAGADSTAGSNGNGSAPAAEAPIPEETTDGGLRKRVPGAHVKAVAERSPLLKSAAGNSDRPLKAETSPQEAQNLASLLTDYTAGLDRGKEELAEASTSPESTE